MAILDLAAIPTFASDTTFHVVVESPRLGRQAEYEPRWPASAPRAAAGLLSLVALEERAMSHRGGSPMKMRR